MCFDLKIRSELPHTQNLYEPAHINGCLFLFHKSSLEIIMEDMAMKAMDGGTLSTRLVHRYNSKSNISYTKQTVHYITNNVNVPAT